MSTDISTVKDLITRNTAERGESPFIEFYDEVVTYRELDERSDAFARYLLSKGIRKGDIVAFMMANSPSFFYVLLGAQKIGAIAGPVSCWWQDKELQHLVDDAEPPILIVDDEFAPIVSKIKDTMASVKTIVVNSPSKLSLDFEHEHLPRRPRNTCWQVGARRSAHAPRMSPRRCTPRAPRASPRASCTPIETSSAPRIRKCKSLRSSRETARFVCFPSFTRAG